MKITSIKYFKFSWLIPIATSFLALVAEEFLHRIGIELPSLISSGIGKSVLGLTFFFIPYIAMVFALLIFLQNKSKKTHAMTILLSPLVMTLLISVFILLAGGEGNKIEGLIFYGRYALMVGYFYVALIFILFSTLRHYRVVED